MKKNYKIVNQKYLSDAHLSGKYYLSIFPAYIRIDRRFFRIAGLLASRDKREIDIIYQYK